MRALILACAVWGLTACASVLGSKQKDFDLRSTPDGADVFLNGNRVGTTPVTVKLSNQAQHTFVFKKAGYKDGSCTLARGTGAGWVIFDVVTGLVPIIIDAATNSWSQTKGSNCTGALQPITDATAQLPTKAMNVPAPEPAPASPEPPTSASSQVPSPGTSMPGQSQVPPVAGYTELPPGTNYVGDARIRKYYPPGCAAQHAIPADQQIFFQTAEGAERDGFSASADC
jgi:PEGA domain